MPIYNAVSKAFGDTGSAVYTQNGNPVTDREWVARADNVMSWLGAQWTNQALQVAGEAGKLYHGKTTPGKVINKFFGATQSTKAIPASDERRRQQKERERFLERTKDVWDKQRRARKDYRSSFGDFGD